MYTFIYEKLKSIFPELTVGANTFIYPSQAPDNVDFDDVIIYSSIGNDQEFHSKMGTVQVSCYSKDGLRSVEMCDAVRKLFNNKTCTGEVLMTNVRGGVDMIFDNETKYFQSNCDIVVQSTNEFV